MTGIFTNEDCMEVMKRYPDNYFQLAIVDPPYGGGCSGHEWDKRKRGRFGGLFDKYHITPGDEHDSGGGRFDRYVTTYQGEQDGRDMGGEVLRGYL